CDNTAGLFQRETPRTEDPKVINKLGTRWSCAGRGVENHSVSLKGSQRGPVETCFWKGRNVSVTTEHGCERYGDRVYVKQYGARPRLQEVHKSVGTSNRFVSYRKEGYIP